MSAPLDPDDVSPQSARPVVRRPPRRTMAERLILSLGVIGTSMALLSAGVLAYGLEAWQDIAVAPIDELAAAEEGEAENWLLVGSDSRAGIDESDPNAGVIIGEGSPEGKRTDTIIIARLDPNKAEVHLLSFPRDLLVSYPDGGDGRINAAFNGDGGEERLLSTIEANFDLEIHHYAEINLAGFQDVVNAIDGVPIWFDRPMRDAGSGLDIGSAGCHVLNGSQALAFARSRNLEYFENGSWRLDGTGDLGRTSRQQYFLKRVASTAINRLDITELGTVNALLSAGGENFTRDAATGPTELVELARTFANLSDEQIVSHSLPVFGFRTSTGAAVLGLDQEAAAPILGIFRGEELQPAAPVLPPSVYAVHNGSRVAGQATEVARALNGHGLDVPSVANAPTTERTVVRYPPGQEHGAERLASLLVAGPAFEVDSTLTEVVLVTGADFEGIRATARENVTLPESEPSTPSTDTPGTTAASSAQVAATDTTVGVVPGPTPQGTLCE